MYEIPWQFGLGAFSCYVFGIAHTVADVRIPWLLFKSGNTAITTVLLINEPVFGYPKL